MSGGPALGPVVDVVDFAGVPGHIASRVRAALCLWRAARFFGRVVMRLVRPSHRARPVTPSKIVR